MIPRSTTKVLTPYGEGQLWDRFEDGMISVRLPVNDLTLTIPDDRLVTKGSYNGVWKFYVSELEELK